jgi:hypothetical protein
MLKWIILAVVAIALIGAIAVTWYVQREAPFKQDKLVSAGREKALILYHPSRDAHFSDELTEALAQGFADTQFSVERWTMTGETPAQPQGFAVIAVVSNTFYARPDRPTMHYLERADFKSAPVIAIMAGAGSTDRAQGLMTDALKRSGADLRTVRSLWISRPNDEARMTEDNRAVARSIARKMASDVGAAVRSAPAVETVSAAE